MYPLKTYCSFGSKNEQFKVKVKQFYGISSLKKIYSSVCLELDTEESLLSPIKHKRKPIGQGNGQDHLCRLVFKFNSLF